MVSVLAYFPSFMTPLAERIENDQTGIGTTGLLEILSRDIFVRDHHNGTLFDVLKPQRLMSAAGDDTATECIVCEHGRRYAGMLCIKVIRGWQRRSRLQKSREPKVAFVPFCGGLTQLKDLVRLNSFCVGHVISCQRTRVGCTY